MNNKKAKGSPLGEKIRKAAANLKDKSERAKNMSEENKAAQEQENVQETAEQIDHYLGLNMKLLDVRRLPGLMAFVAENAAQ